MSFGCKGCGVAFGQVRRRHRVGLVLASGIMLGGDYCADCYGPLVHELTETLAQAGGQGPAAVAKKVRAA